MVTHLPQSRRGTAPAAGGSSRGSSSATRTSGEHQRTDRASGGHPAKHGQQRTTSTTSLQPVAATARATHTGGAHRSGTPTEAHRSSHASSRSSHSHGNTSDAVFRPGEPHPDASSRGSASNLLQPLPSAPGGTLPTTAQPAQHWRQATLLQQYTRGMQPGRTPKKAWGYYAPVYELGEPTTMPQTHHLPQQTTQPPPTTGTNPQCSEAAARPQPQPPLQQPHPATQLYPTVHPTPGARSKQPPHLATAEPQHQRGQAASTEPGPSTGQEGDQPIEVTAANPTNGQLPRLWTAPSPTKHAR